MNAKSKALQSAKKGHIGKPTFAGLMSASYKHPHGTSTIGGASHEEIKHYERELNKKHGKGNWSRTE